MIDTKLQTKFATCCADAAFGYANATAAANVAMLGQVFDFWASVARAVGPQPQTKSWYRSPDELRSETVPPWAMWWAVPFGLAGGARASAPGGASFGMAMMPAPADAFKAWFDMFPLRGSAASWPMAYSMMSAGVPRDVAWPAAEANVAVIEATETAKQQMTQTFSSYRSTGGHATAQIVIPGQLALAAATVPLAVQFLWPWLSAVG